MPDQAKRYKMMLVTPSGREYMIDLVAVGAYHTEPPFVAWEQDDGTIEVNAGMESRRYSSVSQLASEHGLVAGEFVSVDPVN